MEVSKIQNSSHNGDVHRKVISLKGRSKGRCARLFSSVMCALLYSRVRCALLCSSGKCALLYSSGRCALLYSGVRCILLYSSGKWALLCSSGKCALLYSSRRCALLYSSVRDAVRTFPGSVPNTAKFTLCRDRAKSIWDSYSGFTQYIRVTEWHM